MVIQIQKTNTNDNKIDLDNQQSRIFLRPSLILDMMNLHEQVKGCYILVSLFLSLHHMTLNNLKTHPKNSKNHRLKKMIYLCKLIEKYTKFFISVIFVSKNPIRTKTKLRYFSILVS